MKKIVSMLMIAATAVLASCGGKNGGGETKAVELSLYSLTFENMNNTEKEISVIGPDPSTWSAVVDEAARSWCTLKTEMKKNVGKIMKVSVSNNTTVDDRTATITVTSGGATGTITVKQLGASGAIVIGKTKVEMPSKASKLSISVGCEDEYTVDIPTGNPWITIDQGASTETMVVFNLAENPNKAKRPVKVTFSRVSGGGVELNISQRGQLYVAPDIATFPDKIQSGSALETELLSIFTDNMYCALKPGVTSDQIDAMSNDFFRNVAADLFTGVYETSFRVGEFKAYPNPDTEANTLRTMRHNKLDHPTGIVFPKPGVYIVFVSQINDSHDVKLVMCDYPNLKYDGTSYALKAGLNKITVTDGFGLGYIQNRGTSYDPVKINFMTGEVNGYFDPTKHSMEDYQNALTNATWAVFDLVGKKSIITFTTEGFRQYTPANLSNGNNPVRLLEVADSVVMLEEQLSGITHYRGGGRKNKHLYRAGYGKDVYMNASNYRTEYGTGTAGTLCRVSSWRFGVDTGSGDDACWGPAHEVGHTNQLRDGFNWTGMGEVSNNLFSLYVQWTFRKTNPKAAKVTRMQLTNSYTKGIANFANNTPHAKLVGSDPTKPDVFVKLVPFWQLYLYFMETGRMGGLDGFYPQVFEAIRQAENPSTPGACQLQFVKVCCDVAQLDLTDFFTKWGFLRPIDEEIGDYSTKVVKVTQAEIDAIVSYASRYPAPAHDITTITDLNWEDFR